MSNSSNHDVPAISRTVSRARRCCRPHRLACGACLGSTVERADRFLHYVRVYLRWCEVRRAGLRRGGALALWGDSERVLVPLMFVDDFDRTLAWIAQRVHVPLQSKE